MKAALVLALAACATPPAPPTLSNRARRATTPPAPPALVGDAGLHGPATKASIEAQLPGSVANVSDDGTIVVELEGSPQPYLVRNSVPAGVAMLVFPGATEIFVFAPAVRMSHALRVGMSLDDARRSEPELACKDDYCKLPAHPRFVFFVHANRIDHVVYRQNWK